MEQKIKVAHVIRVFSYGGAEILLREFFTNPIFKQAVSSHLYILDHKKLGLVPEVEPHVRKVRHYKISSLLFPFEYIKFLWEIIGGKYDIIHMHLPVAGWLTIPAKIFTRKTKYVYSEHNLVTFYSKYNYYLSGLVYRFFDCVIYVSKEVGEVIKKVHNTWFFHAKRSVMILNGTDTDKFSNAHRASENVLQQFTVGLVARFRPQKRVDRWVEVAYETHTLNPNIKFLMVGDGPDDEMLREKIERLGMKDKIELPGMLSDTFSAFKRMDIFLLTSDFEGLPLALMEAMSTGCVPVVSNVGGIKQLEFDGFGKKFDGFDAKQIAETIAGYASNPEKFRKESASARDFIQRNYSLTKQVEEVLNLYKDVLEHT